MKRFCISVDRRHAVKRKRIVIAAFVVLFFGVAFMVYMGQKGIEGRDLYYSGTIEATQSELSFQVAGRVLNVYVDEGMAVAKDQILADLDASEYRAGLDQSRANRMRAERNLAQSKTLLEIARKTLPADVVRAEAGVTSARDVMNEARNNKQRYDQLYERGVVSKKEWEAVKLHYDTAVSGLTEAEAVLRQARSSLGKIEATEREIEALEAQAKAAGAACELAEIQLERTKLKAPYPGIITSRNVEPGNVVAPTRQVFTLSDLSSVKLKIYVGENEIGKVKPGQKTEVKIDTFPDKVYTGFVSYVSPEGEFTPKIIQTHKERVKLVYLVEITLSNPDLELKTGMPADAWLR